MIPLHSIRRWRPPFDKKRRRHPMPPISTTHAPQISIYRSIHRTRVITEYIKINRNTVDIWKYVPFIIRTSLRALLRCAFIRSSFCFDSTSQIPIYRSNYRVNTETSKINANTIEHKWYLYIRFVDGDRHSIKRGGVIQCPQSRPRTHHKFQYIDLYTELE